MSLNIVTCCMKAVELRLQLSAAISDSRGVQQVASHNAFRPQKKLVFRRRVQVKQLFDVFEDRRIACG